MKNLRANIQVKCNNERKHFAIYPTVTEVSEDNYIVSFVEKEKNGCRVGSLKLRISRKNPWDMTGLSFERPIQLELHVDEQPEAITAMYMFNEWWTRPAFIENLNMIPDKTQIVFLKYKDYYSCFLPAVGKVFKTTVCSGENKSSLYLRMDAGVGGLREADETVYLTADGKSVEEAVHKVFNYLNQTEGIILRNERVFPECFQYLGWCSWDAFYKEINEEKFRAKADELIEKKVPVRWMLFDDGWMTGREDMVSAYEPDREKFPNGFDALITDIKNRSNINWFGVWHAFGGYWAGVDPSSELAVQEKEHLYATVNGRLVPDPENGAGFYENWYKVLKEQQIDFVKVDGQSAVPIYFQQDQPTASAARGMNRELEKGTALMEGNVINCMGMAMENILARPTSGLSRNSDDFVPKKEGGFAEHLLQNAYNSIYHNEIYHCDWDMFWTMHPDTVKHSLIRAISGGPVYFSDRIGETNPEAVNKLCYEDGKLLLLEHSAKPTEDCIFTDPLRNGILKLQNTGKFGKNQMAGVIAAFNLTKELQKTTISAKDIPELEAGSSYWLYDYFSDHVEILEAGAEKEIVLHADEYAYYIFLPKKETVVCAGLADKYAGFTSVEEIETNKTTTQVILSETGSVVFFSETEPKKVMINGKDTTELLQKKKNLYKLNTESASGKMKLEIEF